MPLKYDTKQLWFFWGELVCFIKAPYVTIHFNSVIKNIFDRLWRQIRKNEITKY